MIEKEIIHQQKLKNEGEVVFIITLTKERKKGYFLETDNFKGGFKKYIGCSLPFAKQEYKKEIKAARELIRLSKSPFNI